MPVFESVLVFFFVLLGCVGRTHHLSSAEEVLREALPEGVVVPQSFETAGHIAHLNLRDEHMPFKHVIGEVLLDVSLEDLLTTLKNITSALA